MKLYTDTLTYRDLYEALPDGVELDAEIIVTPRKRERGWIVRLSSPNGRRRRNSGVYGAEEIRAATWDEHGAWMSELYRRDPQMIVGPYESADDFHAKTDDAYASAEERERMRQLNARTCATLRTSRYAFKSQGA